MTSGESTLGYVMTEGSWVGGLKDWNRIMEWGLGSSHLLVQLEVTVLWLQLEVTVLWLTFLQLADVGCAIHLCTLLHQRYGEFSEMLLDKLQQIYQTPIGKEEEKVSCG